MLGGGSCAWPCKVAGPESWETDVAGVACWLGCVYWEMGDG